MLTNCPILTDFDEFWRILTNWGILKNLANFEEFWGILTNWRTLTISTNFDELWRTQQILTYPLVGGGGGLLVILICACLANLAFQRRSFLNYCFDSGETFELEKMQLWFGESCSIFTDIVSVVASGGSESLVCRELLLKHTAGKFLFLPQMLQIMAKAGQLTCALIS